MSDGNDANVWVAMGSAVGGVLTGIGAIFGVKKYRGVYGESYVSNTEFEQLRSECRLTSSELQKLKYTMEHTEKAVEKFNATVERIHTRLDEIVVKLANLEGFNEGRNGK